MLSLKQRTDIAKSSTNIEWTELLNKIVGMYGEKYPFVLVNTDDENPVEFSKHVAAPREWIRVGPSCEHASIDDLLAARPELYRQCVLVSSFPRQGEFDMDNLRFLMPQVFMYRGMSHIFTDETRTTSCSNSTYSTHYTLRTADTFNNHVDYKSMERLNPSDAIVRELGAFPYIQWLMRREEKVTPSIDAKYAQMLRQRNAVGNGREWSEYMKTMGRDLPKYPCVVIGEALGWNAGYMPKECILVGPKGDYRTVMDLFNDRPQIVGRCNVILNWVQADDEPADNDFPDDVKCISVLEPFAVMYRGSYDRVDSYASFDGSAHLRHFINDPTILGYRQVARADLIDVDADRLGLDVTLQFMVLQGEWPNYFPKLPAALSYEGTRYMRRA